MPQTTKKAKASPAKKEKATKPKAPAKKKAAPKKTKEPKAAPAAPAAEKKVRFRDLVVLLYQHLLSCVYLIYFCLLSFRLVLIVSF